MSTAIPLPDHTSLAAHPDTPTAYRLLPPELLLDIFALCDASSRAPTTCRACASDLLAPGQLPHRTWAHRHIFLNPEYDPQTAWAIDGPLPPSSNPWGPEDMNELYPRVAQIQSRLGFYLKARVPVANNVENRLPYAAGLAPPVVPEHGHVPAESTAEPSVLSVGLVDWLFGKAGPFGRASKLAAGHGGVDVVVELRKRRKVELDEDSFVDGEDDEYKDDKNTYSDWPFDDSSSESEEAEPKQQEAGTGLDRHGRVPNWQLVPDALLLAHFFIRTTQLGLLERTLTHLRAVIPSIATALAPISVWSFCMLDNRTELRNDLSELATPRKISPITYPTFLCLLALFDWSKPALDIISRIFSDSVDLRAVLTWIQSHPLTFYCALDTLDLLTSPPSTSARVLDILDLYRQHDVPIDLSFFNGISPYITGSYRIFFDVLIRFDLPNMPRPLDACGGHFRIGKAIVDWVHKGHAELVEVALKYDLLDGEALKQVRTYAAACGDDELVARLTRKLVGLVMW